MLELFIIQQRDVFLNVALMQVLWMIPGTVQLLYLSIINFGTLYEIISNIARNVLGVIVEVWNQFFLANGKQKQQIAGVAWLPHNVHSAFNA